MADKLPEIPPKLDFPDIAYWLFERGMDYNAGAEFFGTSRETMRKLCKPFGHPKRAVPNPELMVEITLRSNGVLQPNGFYQPAAQAA